MNNIQTLTANIASDIAFMFDNVVTLPVTPKCFGEEIFTVLEFLRGLTVQGWVFADIETEMGEATVNVTQLTYDPRSERLQISGYFFEAEAMEVYSVTAEKLVMTVWGELVTISAPSN